MENLDKAGAVLSVACALHCVLMPLGIGLLASSGLHWIADTRVEYTILASTVVVACFSLITAYRQRHRKRRCLAMFLLGLSGIFSGHAFAPGETMEAAAVTAGAALIFAAHLSNAWLCKQCGSCQVP